MKNKKGFTLIELLAVIVILAIIALIAVPIVLNMISQARRSAARSAALGYIDAIEYNNGFANIGSDAEISGYTAVTSGDVSTITSTLGSHLKGKAPTSGSVVIAANGKVTNATLCISGYTVTYENNDVSNVTKGCSENSSSSSPYAYSTGEITNSSEGSSTRPENAYIYNRYELTNGEIASGTKAEYCIYSDAVNDELCLKHGEYETSVQKIKTFYGYNPSTWTISSVENEGTPSEITNWTNSVNNFGCSEEDGGFGCSDNVNDIILDGTYAYISAYSNGVVAIGATQKDGQNYKYYYLQSH